jgi:predicted O-methyltransferase YrrM
MSEYTFTGDSFSSRIPTFSRILKDLDPCRKVLEIGCYEGRSTVWLIENVLGNRGESEIYCVDPWTTEWKEAPSFWAKVEQQFDRNVELATRGRAVTVRKLKGRSIHRLAGLVAGGHSESFDCVYVDGNHQAAEVLSDFALAIELAWKGGIIICDDYLWKVTQNPVHAPKIAIDAVALVYCDKLRQLPECASQAWFIKEYGRSDPQWSGEVMAAVWKDHA